MHEGARFDLVAAKEAVAMTWEVAGEQRRAVLVDMRGVLSETREAREYFASPEVAEKVSAVALVVESPVSRMIANFLIRLTKHYVPTRMFSDSAIAQQWLKQTGNGR